jgi:hypothetical protein
MTTHASSASIDGVLVQWGERLFYPASRIVRPVPPAGLDTMTRRKAAVIRQRIYATVVRRAPQVMVKVTGGGRGMGPLRRTSATSAKTVASASKTTEVW